MVGYVKLSHKKGTKVKLHLPTYIMKLDGLPTCLIRYLSIGNELALTTATLSRRCQKEPDFSKLLISLYNLVYIELSKSLHTVGVL